MHIHCLRHAATATRWALALATLSTGLAHAALDGRDLNGDTVADAYYDTLQNMTWLADASLAGSNTFGISGFVYPDGAMGYPAANQFIAAMNTAHYLGQTTWRMPTALNQLATSEMCARGWSPQPACNTSEMGSLFYNTLGGTMGMDIATSTDPDLAKFSNLKSAWYFTTTEALGGRGNLVLDFHFDQGIQGNSITYRDYDFVWAVTSGDVGTPVGSVPEPETYALMLAGMGIVALRARRSNDR